MTTAKRHYSTADKPRVQGEADTSTRATGKCLTELEMARGRIKELERQLATRETVLDDALTVILGLEAENHATRNEMQVWQLRVHALQAALSDLLTAINAIPYNYIVISYLERIEPQMVRAGEVLAACGELAKETNDGA